MSPLVTWALVAVGGAVGAGIGLLVMRRPSPRRLLISTATMCAVMGIFSAYPYWPAATAPVTFGVLGSAVSMVAVGSAPPTWLDSNAILRSTRAVTRKLAIYCTVGVTFALVGYLTVRAGTTLYMKLR